MPPKLVWTLQAMGLNTDEARGTASMVVAAVTEAVSEAELTWEQAWRQHELEVGVPIVATSREATEKGGVCSACREYFSRLYWVNEFSGPAARALLQKCSTAHATAVPESVMPPRQTNGGQAASGAAVMSRRAALEKAAKKYAEHAGVTVCHVCAQKVVCERYVQYDPTGAVAKQRATEARDQTQSELETEMKRSEEERGGLRGRSGSITRAASVGLKFTRQY